MPAETAGGKPTTVPMTVETSVIDALQACRDENGEFDEFKYVKMVTGFEKGFIDETFRLIQNKEHWKFPIDVMVDDDKVALTVAAIRHMHADEPKVTPLGEGKTRIQGRGYQG